MNYLLIFIPIILVILVVLTSRWLWTKITDWIFGDESDNIDEPSPNLRKKLGDKA